MIYYYYDQKRSADLCPPCDSMIIHYNNKTKEAAGSNVYEAVAKLGFPLHAPCGGHARCLKCLVAVKGAAEPGEREKSLLAHLTDEEKEEIIKRSGAGDDCEIRYACMCSAEEVFVPSHETLTGASTGDMGKIANFTPSAKCIRVSLVKPTIAAPVSTEVNLIEAAKNIFEESELTVAENGALAEASALVSAGITDLWITAVLDMTRAGLYETRVIRVTENEVHPLGLSVDIGTTTVAYALTDLSDGKCLKQGVGENPQRVFGGDVISRMTYESEHTPEALAAPIRERIADYAQTVSEDFGGIDSIVYVVIAGNSAMQHMFMGIPTGSFAKAPFNLVSRFGYAEIMKNLPVRFAHPDAPVYLAPLAASYVGGDITAGLAWLMTERPKLFDRSVLFMDLGTNGELCAVKDGRILAAATAAGPALEGAQITMGMPALSGAVCAVKPGDDGFECKVIGGTEADGICGSGVISAVAAGLDTGLITSYGRICDDGEAEEEEYEDIYERFEHCIEETDDGTAIRLTGNVVLTSSDIRQVQTAKAAIAAGVTVLLEGAGIDEPDIICLAGSFGGGINAKSAERIGLIRSADKAEAVGNTSAKGAALYMLSRDMRATLSDVAKKTEYTELSTSPKFTDAFISGMIFGDEE